MGHTLSKSTTFTTSTVAIIILIGVVAFTEITSYIWHRWMAHSDIIEPIHNTHRLHHNADVLHEANEDFVWSLLIILALLIVLMVVYSLRLVTIGWFMYMFVLATIAIIGNWYIHSAYHKPDHWLNDYAWFQQFKREHFVHHIKPDRNYGIATRAVDKMMFTYEDPNNYAQEINQYARNVK